MADPLIEQYERWLYPKPAGDVSRLVDTSDSWLKAAFGDRPISVLVAGCGANQAARVALHNPACRVTGIDLNGAAIEHEQALKERHLLSNLELVRLSVERAAELGTFSAIICTGVLHHLESPEAGLSALASCLTPDGQLCGMVYARYGRVGVDILKAAFSELEMKQDRQSVAVIRETLASLPPNHPVRSYLSLARDLDFDGGIVDTFLNARERSYTVKELLALVDGAGLKFSRWLDPVPYSPDTLFERDSPAYQALIALPEVERWSVMEKIVGTNAQHAFIAGC